MAERPDLAPRVRALLSIWLGLALIEVVRTLLVVKADGGPLTGRMVALIAVWWVAWLLLAFPAALVSIWAGPERGGWLRTAAVQLPAALAFVALQALVATAVSLVTGLFPGPPAPLFGDLLGSQAVRAFGVYLAGVGGAYVLRYHGLRSREEGRARVAELRAAELEAEAARTSEATARAGLELEWMHGELDRVRAAALRQDPAVAEALIASLGATLRYVLGRGASEIDARAPALRDGPDPGPRRRLRLAPAALAAVGAFWAVSLVFDIGVDFATASARGVPAPPVRGPLIWWAVWIALTPIILSVAGRLSPERMGWPALLAAHLGAGVAFVIVQAALAVALFVPPGIPAGDYAAALLAHLRAFALSSLGIYLGAVAIFLATRDYGAWRERARAAADARLRAARLEALVAAARADALRKDLQPHFLYNALQSAAGLVRASEGDRAARLIGALDELLESSARGGADALVPLEEELDLLRRYLAIETVRFEDRMRVDVDVPLETRSALVPPLMLQPLVENAVRHGVARRAAPVTIRLTARALGDSLELCVEDDGPGPPRSDPREGVGLGNTRERLRHLYGSRAELTLAERDAGGAVARVSLPLQRPETPATHVG